MTEKCGTAFEGHTSWHWIRIYYFEECKDDLILDGVRPGIEQVLSANPGAKAYFERDWIGGPNILVGFRRAGDQSTLSVTAGVQFMRDYIERHPSSTVITDDDFAHRIRNLAALEGRRPQDLARGLMSNNTVLVDCEEPFSPLIKPGALQEAIREFRCRTTPLVMNWLALVREGAWQRQHVALQTMIALAWLADPHRLRSHASFASHASGLLRFMGSDGKLKQAFEDSYRGSEGEAMRSYLVAAVDALREGKSPLPGMSDYLALLRETMTDLFAGLQTGRYEPPPLEQVDKSRRREVTVVDAQIIQKLNQLMGTSTILQTWRLVINLVYRILNQMGISALERYLACYLIARAAEDVYGQSTDNIAKELAHTGDANEMITFFKSDQGRAEKSDPSRDLRQVAT